MTGKNGSVPGKRYGKVSCIIPAFNEELRIGAVIRAVYGNPRIGEIIVVDDGSSDSTLEIVHKFGNIRIVENGTNRGKSYAVAKGLRSASNDIVFLLDADLVNLSPSDIDSLILPVLNGRVDVCMSRRASEFGFYDRIVCGIFKADIFTGERVFDKRLFERHYALLEKTPCYGFEVLSNELFFRERLRIGIVHWKRVYTPRKIRKTGIVKGILGDMRAGLDIVKTVGLLRTGYQMYKMRSVQVRRPLFSGVPT